MMYLGPFFQNELTLNQRFECFLKLPTHNKQSKLHSLQVWIVLRDPLQVIASCICCVTKNF